MVANLVSRAKSKVGRIAWEHCQNTPNNKDCFTFLVSVANEEGYSLPDAGGYSRFSTLDGVRWYCDRYLEKVTPKEAIQDADVAVMQYPRSIHLGILYYYLGGWRIIHCSARSGLVEDVCFDKSFTHRWVATYRLNYSHQ